MNRIIYYQCTSCGRLFDTAAACKNHETKCADRYYLAQNHKKRLRNYIQSLINQGFTVSVVCNENTLLVSVTDSLRTAKKRRR